MTAVIACLECYFPSEERKHDIDVFFTLEIIIQRDVIFVCKKDN